jgi:hypothetical protein
MNVRQVIPRDAIPSVDDPAFVADYTGPETDDVVAVEIDGEARGYPVRYLHYHEIVNDTLAETPIAVTWCPLCGSAVVYDRRVGDEDAETASTFGVSGKLADDDLVMYDRETESEWKQSSGRCIAGVHEGEELTVLPAALTTWSVFRDQYPEGDVLAPPGGQSEASGPGDEPEPIDYDVEPYARYFETDGFGLGAHRGTGSDRTWDRDDVDPKTVVLGLEVDGRALGFPLPVVDAAGGAVTTTLADTKVVVFATDDGIHAFEHPGYEFVPAEDGRFRADGTVWNGATGEGDDGRTLARLPARRLFAFAWQDDHGAAAFYALD